MVGRNLQISLCPCLHGLALRLLLTAHHSGHGVRALHGAAGIHIVGNVERLGIELHAVAVEIVLHVVVFLAKDAPGTEDACIGLDSNKSAVELFGGTLCERCCKGHHGHHGH